MRLDENLRQRDPAERHALEHVRTGSIEAAVDWYATNGRIHTTRDRIGTLVDAVLAADADRAAGHDTLLLAWRRRDVAALNRLARHRAHSTGRITGRSLEAPGGRHYAVGDPVVVLEPDPERTTLVTSQRGTVTAVDHQRQALTVTFDDGRTCPSTVTPSAPTASTTPTPPPSTAPKAPPPTAPTTSPAAAAESSPTSPSPAPATPPPSTPPPTPSTKPATTSPATGQPPAAPNGSSTPTAPTSPSSSSRGESSPSSCVGSTGPEPSTRPDAHSGCKRRRVSLQTGQRVCRRLIGRAR